MSDGYMEYTEEEYGEEHHLILSGFVCTTLEEGNWGDEWDCYYEATYSCYGEHDCYVQGKEDCAIYGTEWCSAGLEMNCDYSGEDADVYDSFHCEFRIMKE